VFGSDIHQRTISAGDVRSNTLTGKQILESSLGKVPSAAGSDTAGVAATALAYGGFTATKLGASPLVLSNGQTQEVFRKGPFVFSAKCVINADPDGGGPRGVGDYADIVIDTSADNAAFDGDASDADFDAADPPAEFVSANTEDPTDPTTTPEFDQESDNAALGADGTEVTGNLYAGVNVAGEVGKCRFGGFFASD
jgi:hypothetical protein